MKKLGALIIGFALLSAFYACQKDQLGVYNPKMKISEVYSETGGHYLQEQWIWNGDNLSRINYYKKNGDLNYSQNYVYDGNRVVRIESDDLHSEFIYDGKKLSEIKTYRGEELLDTYVFSYEKDKLSHLSVNQQSKSVTVVDFLGCFIPGFDQLMAEKSHFAEEKGAYDFYSAEIDFSWMEDDIRHMKAALSLQGVTRNWMFTYVYDENLNPKYNFLSLSVGQQIVNDNPVNLFFSKHNVTSIYVADRDASSSASAKSYYYSYDYYKKYPTKMYSMYVNPENNREDSVLLYSFRY